MRIPRGVPRLKTQKARAPIILASGPSKPYEVWRLQLSAHAHVPHIRQIAGQQRAAARAILIENNLYEAKQPGQVLLRAGSGSIPGYPTNPALEAKSQHGRFGGHGHFMQCSAYLDSIGCFGEPDFGGVSADFSEYGIYQNWGLLRPS
jgi:hypothetical protein